jgi:beta-lactamase superfamily II metal-dependent hydrolase
MGLNNVTIKKKKKSYNVSSRTARAIQRNPVSKKQTTTTKQQKSYNVLSWLKARNIFEPFDSLIFG